MRLSKTNQNRTRVPELLTRGLGLVLVLLLGLLLEARTGKFWNAENFVNLLHHSAVLGLLAMGLTFVVITGEFDLGLANLNGLTGMVVAEMLIRRGWGAWQAVAATLLMGLLLGMIVGFLVGYRRYHSIAVTLAAANIYLGLAYALSEGQPIRGTMPEDFRVLGTGSFLALPIVVWVLIFCSLAGYFVLHRHKFGHYLYAIGSQRDASMAAGIPVARLSMATFLIAGTLSALGACMNTAWIGSGQPRVGPGYMLPMFAAVFFGIAINAGRPTLLGSLQGMLLVAVISNGTTLLGLTEFASQMLVGSLLWVSVLIARLQLVWSRRGEKPV